MQGVAVAAVAWENQHEKGLFNCMRGLHELHEIRFAVLIALNYGLPSHIKNLAPSKSLDEWLRKQDDTVLVLWYESWMADDEGDEFKPLPTLLKGFAFWNASQILVKAGLFEFEPEYSPVIKDVIGYWKVRNLQAAKAQRTSQYHKFLNSDYWQGVRQQVLARDRHTCQHCGAIQNLNVHHLTYEHHGEEHLHLDDLLTLCRSCHAKEHGRDS